MPDPYSNQDAVREVALTALRGALPGERQGEEIPSELLDAVALGRGDREEVRETTRRLFGTEHPLELVLFDTDRIASYVFESSRPPVITGASRLLRELNTDIRKAYGGWVLFSGGGEGMLLVPSGKGKGVCLDVEDRYARKTAGALAVTTGFLPVGPHDFIALDGGEKTIEGACLVSGTRAVLAALRDQVRQKKDAKAERGDSVPGEKGRCVSCRDRGEGTKNVSDYREDEPGKICKACEKRWDTGKDEIAGISFEEVVASFREAIGLSPAEGGKTGAIGFLYVDGNGMGALFGGLPSLSELSSLSEAVRRVFERVEERAKEEVEAVTGKTGRERPFVSYLGGGDEAIWILPAALALRVVERLPSWIKEECRGIEGLAELTFGAGLVLCSSHYPVRYQYELARELQKNAKKKFYAGEKVSSIDFEVLTESSPLSEDLASSRALVYRTEEPGFFRTCRPYTMAGFAELLQRIKKARAHEVATSQLYTLQSGSAEGRSIFLNHLRYQIARKAAGRGYQGWLESFDVPVGDPKAIESFFIKDLPDGGSGVWITDGLQLAPFLDQLSREKG